ncbi:stress responsive A/B barrel domain-containing protein [Xylariaceae sp. FL1651]|nr:stress responsive A/B barrel domain-containing protein [Xylariaceae sp. FL1651]
MSGQIHRITMFKLPSPEGQEKLIEAYNELIKQSKKEDGKPYILSMTTGKVMEDPRSQSWTVVNKAEFASMDDMRYYDEQCKAQAELKAKAKTFGISGGPQGIMTVYFQDDAML